MDDTQVGSVIRAVRISRGLRQSDIAAMAGVSQALVSAIECGRLDRTPLRVLRKVAGSIDVSLSVAPRWRGAEIAKLLDERHALVVREVVARLAEIGWQPLPEHTFSVRGERGSIDVLAWHPVARAVLVVEVKTLIRDLQDLLSTMDRKRRLAPLLARELGWRSLSVGSVLVLPDETQVRNVVARYKPVFHAALPARGQELRRWLKSPDDDLRGIWFLFNISPGNGKPRSGGSMRVRRPRRELPDARPRSNRDVEEARALVVTPPRDLTLA